MSAKIGLYSAGLKAYWTQFAGLKDRLLGYNAFICETLRKKGYEVADFGLVDDEESGRKAGEFFRAQGVDLIFLHVSTYVTSSSVVPVHRVCGAPTVVLSLQPTAHVNYEKTTTGEWLAHCNACAAPEIANAFERCGIKYRVISGLLGLGVQTADSLCDEVTAKRPEAKRAWREIEEWAAAANAVNTLKGARFGFLGNNYSGMLDMYSDFTMLTGQTGIDVEILEMCDLKHCLDGVKEKDIKSKLGEINSFFRISGDSAADPLAKKPTEEQMRWSATVACALSSMAQSRGLDALSYYYHGADGNEYEKLQSGLIVGNSLLTANGVPCAGEGDIKTCIAMKICDTLGVGGSFCEIVTTDYDDGTILLGHDGPFHVKIADGKPILRGMGLYHGKRGCGVSVEAKVKSGPVTCLGLTQTAGGKLKFIISEGEATSGKIMQIGNTQTPVRFATNPDTYMERWFTEAPTHHFAMSVGHNAGLFRKVADLMGCDYIII